MTEEQRKLVVENMGLVHAVARRQMRRACQVHGYDEVVQEGMLALAQAAMRYDPTKGKFSTYAMGVVWGRLVDRYSGLRYGRGRNERMYMQALRLDDFVMGGEGDSFVDLMPGEYVTEDQIISRIDMETALIEVDAQRRELVRAYYIDGFTTRELACRYGCSRTTILNRLHSTMDYVQSQLEGA